ncbi:MAG: hypothetical protein ACREIC_08720 [Limisphaerales bacterium]
MAQFWVVSGKISLRKQGEKRQQQKQKQTMKIKSPVALNRDNGAEEKR